MAEKTKRKYTITEEERERRRQAMKERQEKGLVGAEYGKLGGRPRKPRASEELADWAKENADRLKQVLVRGTDKNQPMKIQLDTAKLALSIEQQEADMRLKEDIALENASKEDYIDFIAARLSEGPVAEAIAEKLGIDFIDGDFQEIFDAEEDARALGPGDTEADS